MNSKPDKVLVNLYSHALERELRAYMEAVGPYYTLDDLRELLSVGPRPVFNSKKDLAAFNSEILNRVLSEGLRSESRPERTNLPAITRPPFNAEYILYILLRREERDVVIGDLVEGYREVLERFNKPRADIWFYKQVAGSLLPLLRRALLKIGAFVWLSRVLRRLIS